MVAGGVFGGVAGAALVAAAAVLFMMRHKRHKNYTLRNSEIVSAVCHVESLLKRMQRLGWKPDASAHGTYLSMRNGKVGKSCAC